MLKINNLTKKYPGSDKGVSDLTLHVAPGDLYAFIGHNGAGKTTALKAVCGIHAFEGGEIFVDGINVKEYNLEALHNKLGYVPQKALLFSGTVNTNVAFGSNGKEGYSEDDVKRAVKIAQAKDFVEKMPFSYDNDITQGGTNVSGGQRQRLCIARAVCREPEILIFDDSFSALDYKTDKVLRKTLKEETEGTTNIIVAQRIGTIKDADLIIVLHEGEIVGKGKHKELLENCTVYKEIALSQLSQEELEK